MTDAGQGLALKGADEVGGAQEDNTNCRLVAIRCSSGQGSTGTRLCRHITLPVGAGGRSGYRWKDLGEPVRGP